MSQSKSEESFKTISAWKVDDSNEFEVHEPLLKVGLLLTKRVRFDASSYAQNNFFRVNGRKLFYGGEKDHFSDDGLVITHEQDTKNSKCIAISNSDLAKVKAIRERLLAIANNRIKNKEKKLLLPNNDTLIFNSERRAEIFLPICFGNHDPKNVFHVNPWLHGNKTLPADFDGFDSFIFAGCMIGSKLTGIDSLGGTKVFIKHNIEFYPNQKIIDFEYVPEKDPNPYETMLFIQLEKNIRLIKTLTRSDQPRILYYHLPYYDYLLYGIELYLLNRLTRCALEKFAHIILMKKNEHVETINKICQRYSIDVKILSPFVNLLDLTNHENDPNLLSLILNQLDLISFDNLKQINENASAREIEYVKKWLIKLQENCTDKRLQEIWVDCLKIPAEKLVDKSIMDEINSIEELLKLANAVMIATAAKGHGKFRTCSLLPLSEKQIQLSYDKIQTLSTQTEESKYPQVVNLSYMEPVIPYNQSSKGLLFYYNTDTKSLAALVGKYLTYGALGPTKILNKHAHDDSDKIDNKSSVPGTLSCPNLASEAPTNMQSST